MAALPFRGLQPLPLEGVERSLPGFIEALTGEARAMGSRLRSWDWNPDVLLCIVAPLCSVLSALGPEPRGSGGKLVVLSQAPGGGYFS